MSKKRILFVTQEMEPYTVADDISKLVRKLPQHTQEKGFEIRVLMPKFGSINERRHRLHEVVRLSGMNIIVDDDDYPLIIKVASLPGARMQVYFLDNEEFFKRKFVFKDANGKPFDDNSDRMVFFCKGVMETVKKFGWAPDIIHCHGWMTALVPLYFKTVYKDEPIFQNAQMIYSVYDHSLGYTFTEQFLDKAMINNLEEEDLKSFTDENGINLNKGAIMNSDIIIQGSETIDDSVNQMIEESGKTKLDFVPFDEAPAAYLDFYKSLLEDDEESE
jgi:starch synthase